MAKVKLLLHLILNYLLYSQKFKKVKKVKMDEIPLNSNERPSWLRKREKNFLKIQDETSKKEATHSFWSEMRRAIQESPVFCLQVWENCSSLKEFMIENAPDILDALKVHLRFVNQLTSSNDMRSW